MQFGTKLVTAYSRVLRGFRVSLILAVLLSTVGSAVYTYTRTLTPAPVYAATSSNLNYQARLLSSNGNIVPDGFYNIDFKLYTAASGGVSVWGETYFDSNGATAGNDNRVRVVNGYLSVNLASQTAFPTTINWDQDMWLTMNIGGSTQTATPTYDGEMTPRVKLTAVPYAFQAKQAEKLVSNQGTYTGTVEFGALTADRKYLFPDTNLATTASPGTVCVFNGAVSNCPAATGSASYIQNTIGGATPQAEANFNIQAYNSGTAGTVGGRIRGAANGQTADLFQLQASDGTVLTSFDSAGKLVFGPSGAQDTNLYRSAANTLKTDDSFIVGGNDLYFGSISGINLQRVSDAELRLHTSGNQEQLRVTTNNIFTFDNAIIANSAGIVYNNARISLNTELTNSVGIAIQGVASQTADLLQLQNSAGTTLSSFTASGALQGGLATGSNVAGTNLTLNGGQGTGTGVGGNIVFQIAKPGISGSTANTLQTVASLDGTTGAALFQNSVNSTTAFQIQNAAGANNLFVADTTNSRIAIGSTVNATGATLQVTGTQSFTGANGTVSIGTTGVGPVANGNNGLRIDNAVFASGQFRSDSGFNTSTTSDGLVLESFNLRRASGPRISFGDTNGPAITIDTVVSGSYPSQLLVATSQATTIGVILKGATSQTADLLQLQNSSGTTLSSFTASGALQGGLATGSNTAGTNLTLNGGQGTGTGAGGNINLQIAKPGTTGSTANSLQTVASLNGTNGAALFQNAINSITAFQVQNATGASIFNVDTINAKIGTIDTTAASTSSQVLTIKSGDASGVTSSSGNVVIGSGNATGTSGSITIDSGTGATVGSINIGTGSSGAKTINIGGTAANIIGLGNTQTAGSISIGAALTAGTVSIGGTGAQTGTIDLGSGTGAQSINLGTGGTGAKTVTLGNGSVATSTTIIQGGSNAGMGVQVRSDSVNAFRIQSASGGTTIFNADVANMRITIGGAVGTLANRNLEVAVAEVTTTFRIGDATNNVAVTNVAGGGQLRYNGTARNMKNIGLMPEYAGAVLTGDGTNNVGSMTSDFCGNDGAGPFVDVNTALCASGEYRNYYSWTSQATNDYNIYIRYKLPQDFDGWTSSTSMQMTGWRTSSTEKLKISVWNATGGLCGTETEVNTANTTWQQTAVGGDETTDADCNTTNMAPGSTILIVLNMEVGTNNNFIRAGGLSLDYWSKF